MRVLLYLILVTVFLASCGEQGYKNETVSPLLSKKIKPDSLHVLLSEMADDDNIRFQELSDFHFGLLRLPDDSIEGKTIGDIIEIGKKFKKFEKIEELKNIANAFLVKSVLNIQIKNFEAMEDGDFYRLYVNFKNTSDNSIIRSSSGRIKFTNIRNDFFVLPVEQIPLNLQPGDETVNYFDFKDSLLVNLNTLTANNIDGNLQRIEWQPTVIEFADGNRITIRR